MEFCGYQTLASFARKLPNKVYDLPSSKKIFVQISGAISYLHGLGYGHRDLKLTNIMINSKYQVKIIDFGFACDSKNSKTLYCGTPSYMAPEIMIRQKYHPQKVDVWAMGVVLYKMLTGEYPFGSILFLIQGDKNEELEDNICNVRVEYPINKIHPYFGALLKRIFVVNPFQRPSLQKVII